MIQRRLTREELLSWVGRLLEEQRVVAPVRNEEGLVFLQSIETAAELELNPGQPINSIKEWVFPATETLFRAHRGKGAVRLEQPERDEPQVILAVRPCDAAALTPLDALFLGDPPDAGYAARRRGSTIVGLACQEVPSLACFCTTTGGSPVGTANLDAILYQDRGGYIAEPLTGKGEALLTRAGGTMLEQRFVARAPEMPLYPVPREEEWLRFFQDGYWERLGERCLGCKICTYNCPTCYCFDIRDCGTGGRVERLRAWDACTSKHFYVEASGHDPRPTRGMHLRNRFCHKYYYFPWRYDGGLLCSGCGRCVTQCPVSIDLTEILRDVHAQAGTLEE